MICCAAVDRILHPLTDFAPERSEVYCAYHPHHKRHTAPLKLHYLFFDHDIQKELKTLI